MSSEFSIRPGHPDDAAACAALEAELFRGQQPWSLDAFQVELANPVNTYLVAESKGTLIGYAGLGRLGRPDDPEFEVHTIGVDPHWQGKGVGKALFAGLLAVADAAGGPIFLEVRVGNWPAIGLYTANGFEPQAIRKNYYGRDIDALTMWRPEISQLRATPPTTTTTALTPEEETE